jgi:hypothetical protein
LAQDTFQVTQITLIQHLNTVIFWALLAGHFFSNLPRSEPGNNENNNISQFLRSVPNGDPVGPPSGFLIFYVFWKKKHFISLITWYLS